MSTETVAKSKRKKTQHARDDNQWESLCQQLAKPGRNSVADVFGASVKGGSVYRWGIAAAEGAATESPDRTSADTTLVGLLSKLACDGRISKKHRDLDLNAAAQKAIDDFESSHEITTSDAAVAVLWASALPQLTRHLEQRVWWDLLGCLQQLRESFLQRGVTPTGAHLLLDAELGLTLAWRLQVLPSCKRIQRSAADALSAWCAHEEEAVDGAIASLPHTRLVLASLLRCKALLEKTTQRKWKKQQQRIADDLATWVAASTIHTGQTAFSNASRKELAADLASDGLLESLTEIDPDALRPAVAAALGESQSGGRLAWEVCLPEAFHHSEKAKVAVMFPDWDVRRGRMHIDYSGDQVQLELYAGRSKVLSGPCETMIDVEGQTQQPSGDWELTCEYTDDDVHYLEIEQAWGSDLLLQRQFMLVRDDRCVLVADSVIPRGGANYQPDREIRYDLRLPLGDSIGVEEEKETRELYLGDSKRRGLVLPLSAGEWKVGPTDATLTATPDGHLQLTSSGHGRLYAPIWFDFQQRRFGRKRTWRQLTVAQELRIVGRDEAAGFRIQLGSEQWLVYRSFGVPCPRSVLGKHLVADFFAARFDMGDGSLDELVTVDDHEDE